MQTHKCDIDPRIKDNIVTYAKCDFSFEKDSTEGKQILKDTPSHILREKYCFWVIKKFELKKKRKNADPDENTESPRIEEKGPESGLVYVMYWSVIEKKGVYKFKDIPKNMLGYFHKDLQYTDYKDNVYDQLDSKTMLPIFDYRWVIWKLNKANADIQKKRLKDTSDSVQSIEVAKNIPGTVPYVYGNSGINFDKGHLEKLGHLRVPDISNLYNDKLLFIVDNFNQKTLERSDIKMLSANLKSLGAFRPEFLINPNDVKGSGQRNGDYRQSKKDLNSTTLPKQTDSGPKKKVNIADSNEGLVLSHNDFQLSIECYFKSLKGDKKKFSDLLRNTRPKIFDLESIPNKNLSYESIRDMIGIGHLNTIKCLCRLMFVESDNIHDGKQSNKRQRKIDSNITIKRKDIIECIFHGKEIEKNGKNAVSSFDSFTGSEIFDNSRDLISIEEWNTSIAFFFVFLSGTLNQL
jgi:hypothetical protein